MTINNKRIITVFIFACITITSYAQATKITHGYQLYHSSYLPEEGRVTSVVALKEPINKCNTLWVHSLAITTKAFEGDYYTGYNIPFVGQCTKHIVAIIINGKKHRVDNIYDIYFRQTLKLEIGYNRVYINVELEDGSILSGNYIEINLVRDNPALDVNIK